MLVHLLISDIYTKIVINFIDVKGETFLFLIFDHICFVPVSSNCLKKVKTTVDNLLIEKQKMEKSDKSKKNKGKGKAKLKIEGDNNLLSEYGDYVYGEFDDFM